MSRSMTHRVLVMDAHSTSALAVVRSLGKQGIEVTACGERGEFNIAFHSKYVYEKLIYPSPLEEPDEFATWLLRRLQWRGYEAVIPTTDRTACVISRYRDRFASYTQLGLPAGEILEKAQDKRETLRIALECDIPIPQTTFCKSLDELEKLSKGLRYPVVVKSRYSKYWSGSGRVQSGGTRYVSSAEELVSVYQKLHGLIPDPLIQEFISGQGCAVSLLMDQGEPKALFAHRRIHEENPMGGPSALAEGITPDPRMTEDAVRLLQRMRWQGVAMVEFKQNRRDGTHKLMEVNGRFWGSLPLAIASGVDFPYLLYQSLTGGRVEPVLQYQTGLRGRHLKGEISYLLGVLKGPPSGWREPYPTLASTFADFIKCGRRKTVSYNYSISDPAPGLLEIYDVLFRQLPRSMMGRIVGKRSKGS